MSAAAGAAPELQPPLVSAPIVVPRSAEPLAGLMRSTLDAALAGKGDGTLINLLPFYASRGFSPIWTGNPERLARAGQVVEVLGRAEDEGLSVRAYEVERLAALHAGLVAAGKPSVTLQAEFEFRLSRSLVRYAQDVSSGRAGPEHEQDGGIRSVERHPIALLLASAATATDLPGWLASLPPAHPQYSGLRVRLAEWRAKLGRIHWTQVPTSKKLIPGTAGETIVALRQRLVEEGLLPGPDAETSVPVIYDDRLEAAVRRFQRLYGLHPDGIVGDRTFRALNTTVQQRVEQLRANMERIRWLAPQLGERHVLVNLADFTLRVVEHGRPIHVSRVVVGAPYTATPTMSHEIGYVVLNPYWYVPRSIMIREILPNLQKDPSWVFKERLRIFLGSGRDAKEVNPYTVDWSKVTPSSWRYRIRQDAGPDNSLGVIKFMFPNADAIYLHDTPSKKLFDRSVRAFSHGCIRVQDPLVLADVLLREQGWPLSRLEQVVAGGKPEQRIVLRKPVPIHLVYLTAFIDGSDLQFVDDIYGRDRLLAQALEANES